MAAEKKKPQRIGDGDGLMLVVQPNGSASWVLRYSTTRRTDLTLGRWPTVTLALAREKAEEARRLIAAGADPAEKRAEEKKARASAASPDTLRLLFDDWMATTKSDKSAVYRGNIEAAMKKDVFPRLGAKAPHLVTRAEILEILRAIEERGAFEMVRRLRMWLRELFEFGIDDESRPLLLASPVPMGTLRSFKTRKAMNFPAVTNHADVKALMVALRRTENWTVRAALLFSSYVFQRPTEIREATWAEFDLQQARWVIPAERMKGRLEHWVPLAPQVVELLRQHQGVVGNEGWLFPGRRYGKPLSEGTLSGRLNACGYEGKHSPHGFRAMARTVLDERLKVDTRFIEKQLSHEVDARLKGAYNRAEYWDDRVLMMQAWADWLDAQK
ncbi:tyrosine-type recombinase/integrase [Variovorax paradoxus]|uniref:tyrosine-type recombinase/integrase n=1 Tax=Variovorax paradoxus TaxID=34073 RepID=UPI0013EF175B|nr:integrase arm-type DNA-binding domain-containing protein [Variovorax paradoxus]